MVINIITEKMTINCYMKFVYAKDRRVCRPQRREKEMFKFYNNLTDQTYLDWFSVCEKLT